MSSSDLYVAKAWMDESTFDNADAMYRDGSEGGPKFELISLCMFGGETKRTFAAIWARRPLGARKQEVHFMPRSAVSNRIALLALRGFTPQIVATTDGIDDVQFVIVFRQQAPGDAPTRLDVDLSAADLEPHEDNDTLSLIELRRRQDHRIGWVSSYGKTPGSNVPRYAVLWYPQYALFTKTTRKRYYTVPWTVEVDLDGDEANKRFVAHADGFSRLNLSVPYCSTDHCDKGGGKGLLDDLTAIPDYSPRYLSVWYGDMIGAWAAGGAWSLQACENLLDSPPPGLHPIRLMASGPSNDPIYSVIFGEHDVPRTKYASVLKPYSPVNPICGTGALVLPKLDDWFIELMQKDGIRRLQFALTIANTLVAVRAYSHRENFYQGGALTSHLQPFRQASVSKTLTAFALMKLYSDGALGPAGVNPFDGLSLDWFLGWGGEWKNRSLRDILTHVNGVRVGDPSDATYRKVWNGFPGNPHISLPIDDPKYYEQLLRAQMPASDGQWQYSNPGFLLAGQVIARATPQPYFQWLKSALTPFYIGIYQSRRTLSEVGENEPLYHAGIPGIGKDQILGTQSLRPNAYNFNAPARVGQGGWAISAAEIARLMALMDRATDPLISPAVTKYWLLDDVASLPVPRTDGGTIRPVMGWDTYFTMKAQKSAYGSEAMIKNGRISGAVAVLSRRLLDAATLSITANGELIQGKSAADSFGTGEVDRLFAMIPPYASGEDLFSRVRSEWT